MMVKIASTRDAYGDALIELGRKNPDIFVLDADLSKSTKTDKFSKVFKERFFNMGIAEQNMMDTAVGLALSGKIPFVSTFAVFATLRAGEQVRISIASTRANVKIVATHSGVSVGTAGLTHFSEQDIAIMRSIPNMTVIAPADAPETKKAVENAAEYNGPVYIRLGRGEAPVIYEKNMDYEIGKAITLREGNDITIIATGTMVHRAIDAGRRLAEKGIEAKVIDMHTIKPLDVNVIKKAALETQAIITIEEHNVIGGLGSAVTEVVTQENPVKVVRLGIPDIFCGVASPEELWDQCGMSVDNIVDCAVKLYKNKLK